MTEPMAVDGIDGHRRGNREEGKEFLSKHHTTPHHIDQSDSAEVWRMCGLTPNGTGQSNLSRETKILRFSGANGDRKICFPSSGQMTSSRIDISLFSTLTRYDIKITVLATVVVTIVSSFSVSVTRKGYFNR